MKRVSSLVISGLVFLLGVSPSWGGPPNPTQSDLNGNTAGGSNALAAVSVEAGFNTAFGSGALSKNTTGDSNTACGALALFNNISGMRNTASGGFALLSNTTGNSNTASGMGALSTNNTGSFNTANGDSALETNTAGEGNTALGAFALQDNTGGGFNTATGVSALQSNDTGSNNTATGVDALHDNIGGGYNTATGASALFHNTTGFQNTASGAFALQHNTTGVKNTALGFNALEHSTGDHNIAVGHGAGAALTSGIKNIYLGHPGIESESKTMRLGNVQKKTYIAGINSAAVTGSTVVIDAAGRLGTQLSSARYKRDIAPMEASSAGVLQLRPVTFTYTHDDQGVRQYGLLAEEVAAVYPELVTRTPEGQVQAVRYQELIPMLVNELQRQHRELAELRALVGQLGGRVAER